MVNGTVVGTGNAGTNNADGLRIGASSTLGAFYNVQVAEVIPYSRILTTQEKADITAGLRSYYGI